MQKMSRQAKDRLAHKLLDQIQEINDSLSESPDVAESIAGIQKIGDLIGKIADDAYKVGHRKGFKEGKNARFTYTKN